MEPEQVYHKYVLETMDWLELLRRVQGTDTIEVHIRGKGRILYTPNKNIKPEPERKYVFARGDGSDA